MATAHLGVFRQLLMGILVLVIILGAILVVLIGLPLYWLRLKLERGLIRAIRSVRARRQTEKSTANANESATIGYLFISNEAF
jgi:hypothetical protein